MSATPWMPVLLLGPHTGPKRKRPPSPPPDEVSRSGYEILGPLDDGPARQEYVHQILNDLDRLCHKGVPNRDYAYRNLGHKKSGDGFVPVVQNMDRIAMGRQYKPYLWVLVDAETEKTVSAFCYATLLLLRAGAWSYEIQLVCSERRFGMKLFEAALQHAIVVFQADTSGNDFRIDIEPLNARLVESYQKRAVSVFGRAMEVSVDKESYIEPLPSHSKKKHFMRLVLRGREQAFKPVQYVQKPEYQRREEEEFEVEEEERKEDDAKGNGWLTWLGFL